MKTGREPGTTRASILQSGAPEVEMRKRSVVATMLPTLVGLLFLLVVPVVGILRLERSRAGYMDRLDPARQEIMQAVALINVMRADAYSYHFTGDEQFKNGYQKSQELWLRDARSVKGLSRIDPGAEISWNAGFKTLDSWSSQYGARMIEPNRFGLQDVSGERKLFDAGTLDLRRSYQGVTDASVRYRAEVRHLRFYENLASIVLGGICVLLVLLSWRNSVALHNALNQASRTSERLTMAVRETNHRVKNNLQTIGALIDMHRSECGEKVPGEVLDDIYQQVKTVAAVHDFLTYERPDDRIAVCAMLEKLVTLASSSSNLQSEVEATNIYMSVKPATALALIVNELVLNAGKHGASRLKVQMQQEGSQYRLDVCDNGPGFPSDFNIATHGNLGLSLVETLAQHDLNGEAEWMRSTDLHGARVSIVFPMSETA